MANGEDDIAFAIRNLNEAREDKLKLNSDKIKKISSGIVKTFQTAKRDTQKLAEHKALKQSAGTLRSGRSRFKKDSVVSTNGQFVNKGIDAFLGTTFDEDEKEYLVKQLERMNEISELKYDHLLYLLKYVYLDELKDIKEGKTKSQYHDKFVKLKGNSKADLSSEIRTSLFSNDQKDYLYGLLHGAFNTTNNDDNGCIKHQEIDYVNIVMFAEITIRIVKHVHKFKSYEEALEFMIKHSDETHGLSED